MIVYSCSCGFATDDADWFDGHLKERPGHFQRRMVRDRPGGGPVPPLCSPSYKRSVSCQLSPRCCLCGLLARVFRSHNQA